MTVPGPAVLEVESLRLGFPGRRVLVDLNLQLKRGEILGLIGKVGSGKTQLLRVIAGLARAQSGSVRIGDFTLDPQRRSVGDPRVGYVFQDDNLIPWLTIGENLKICQRPGASITLGSVDESWLTLKPAQLSGGMRQRVNLARGFMNRDEVVLMDEPFSALDPGERRGLQGDFLKLQSEIRNSVIFVTHDLREALLLCHRIAYLSADSGQIEYLHDNPFRGESSFNNPSYQTMYATLAELFDRSEQTR